MSRKEFTPKTKLAAFERCKGLCETCGERLNGRVEYDHRVPCGLGGGNDLGNCEVLCVECHKAKTHGKDRPDINRAKRLEAKHKGDRKRPKKQIQSRGFDKTKSRKFNGEVVKR